MTPRPSNPDPIADLKKRFSLRYRRNCRNQTERNIHNSVNRLVIKTPSMVVRARRKIGLVPLNTFWTWGVGGGGGGREWLVDVKEKRS